MKRKIKKLPKYSRSSMDKGEVVSANITAIDVIAENPERNSDITIWR